jgi:predicted Zn-dependent peptidase
LQHVGHLAKRRNGIGRVCPSFFSDWSVMIHEFILDNGLRVLHEPLPHLRTVALGLWIGTGSRHEEDKDKGLSHCLEHMLFKGTAQRTAAGIAREIDRLGGQINAFTAKDCTCFHTKTLGEDLPLAMDIIADMAIRPLLQNDHLNMEKQVIIEEIGMVEDYPEELVHDIMMENTWAGHPLASPILGTNESVSAFTADQLARFHREHYVPENAVLSVAGDIEADRLEACASRCFGGWTAGGKASPLPEGPVFLQSFTIQRKKTEQAHLCLAFPGVTMDEEDVWPIMVLNNVLGGGMGSRLFQRIREELGLVYSVYSFPTSYQDGGLFSVYAAAAPGKAREVLKRMAEEIGRLAANPVPEEEFARARQQLRGSFLMGLDSTNGHMMAMGRNRIISGRIQQVEEALAGIDSVTPEHVQAVSRRVFLSRSVGFAAVGRVKLSDVILKDFSF